MRALKLLPAIALMLGCQSTPQPIVRTWELPAGVKTAQVNGYEMAYVERGSGDPVILVHGSGVDYRYWAGQMEPFSVKYRTVAVSLRRYYPEPWRGDGDFSLNQQVADLAAFIKQLNAGPVHLVGHSRGGTVALYTTSKVPGMVRTLTFAEGGTGMPAFSSTDPAIVEHRATAIRAMTDKLKKGETDAGLEIFVDYVNGPGAWKTTPDGTKNSLRANAWTLVAGDNDIATWAPFSWGEDAKRVSVPVLLVGGESVWGGRQSNPGQNSGFCLPRHTRAVIEKSSHSMPRMNPSGFSTAVMSFIEVHRPQRACRCRCDRRVFELIAVDGTHRTLRRQKSTRGQPLWDDSLERRLLSPNAGADATPTYGPLGQFADERSGTPYLPIRYVRALGYSPAIRQRES